MESSTPRGMIEAYVPFSLMPVAAVLGLYLLAALVRIGYLIYANTVNDTETLPKRTTARERLLLQQKQQKYASQNAAAAVGWDGGVVPLQSREFGLLFLSLVLVTIAYAFTVARVEGGFQRAAYKAFNPYALLSLSPPAHPDDPPIPAAVIQDAFKAAIQLLKASNADEAQMENVKLAYQALQDERGMRNYQRFGHPNGPLEVPAFCLRIPIWLLYPSGPWSAVVYLLYVGAVLLLLYLTVGWYRDRQEREKSNQRTTQEKDEAAAALLDATNSVAQGDLDFIGNTLNPTSDHMDILYAVCAAPETLQWALKDLDRIQQLKEDRLRQDNKASETDNNKSKKKDDLDLGALLDDGGWDEDEDNGNSKGNDKGESGDSGTPLIGPTKQVFEGVDKDVLGQEWVERTLQKANQWPPKMSKLFKSIEFNGKLVQDPFDHPGLRRVLCMTMGRLNAQMLNSHPQLTQAGAKKMIDQTYFRASMEFRQRVGLLLEGALRLAMMLRSYRLVASIVETVALFRIGCHKGKESVAWFEDMMKKTNGCLPRLKVHASVIISTDYDDDIGTDDWCEFVLNMERTHAENFIKAKIAIAQKQGIPPQMALQMYREGWWLLLRHERLDGPTQPQPMNHEGLTPFRISSENLKLFDSEKPEDQLVTAFPVLVTNIAQQRGNFKLRFQAPSVPGTYKYRLAIRSQDFLGADQEVEVTVEVVDSSKGDRKKREQEEDESKKKK